MPDLRQYKSEELNWSIDFSPRHPLPTFMPVVIVIHNNDPVVAAGFAQKEKALVWGLTVETSLLEALEAYYPERTLQPLESLRRRRVLNLPAPESYLLKLPLEFQNFLDDRSVSIKVLRPLEYLLDWTDEIVRAFVSLKPTGSQVRELLDLLCDLKFKGLSFLDCIPLSPDPTNWVTHLRKLRAPLASEDDDQAKTLVQKMSWPKGVSAKWERHGDQAGIVIQTKVTNSKEWKSLKENLPRLDIGENFWTS